MNNIETILRTCVDKHTARVFKIGKCSLSLACKLKNTVWINNIEVEPEDRGKGLAKTALQTLVDAADAQGVNLGLEAVPLDDDTDLNALIGFYSRFGFRLKKNINNFAIMLRKPQPQEDQHMNIQKLSQQLATAGVKHVVVKAGLSKYSDSGAQFAESIIKALKEQQGQGTQSTLAKAAVIRKIPKVFNAYKGKKLIKPLVDKLKAELGDSKDYSSVIVFSSKSKFNNAQEIRFFLRYGTNESTEFGINLKFDEDGGFDPGATLKDQDSFFKNVLDAAEASADIDAGKLAPLLKEFYDLGNKITDHTGSYVNSFSSLLDFLSRH